MFEETELWRFALDEKSQPGLEKNEDAELLTKWMCDGNATYSFDSKDKKLTEIEIPAEFHGDGLVNSPLPFLFGANRQVLLSRYWIRPITPANATDEYWLLAVPKRIEDARTFSHVELIIARQDFLPKSMIIYPQGYDPKEKPVSHAYVFENRKINNQLANLKDFMGFFIKPKLPRGWEWVKQKAYADEATAQRQELEKLRK
jgi:TIGR03009 family protein